MGGVNWVQKLGWFDANDFYYDTSVKIHEKFIENKINFYSFMIFFLNELSCWIIIELLPLMLMPIPYFPVSAFSLVVFLIAKKKTIKYGYEYLNCNFILFHKVNLCLNVGLSWCSLAVFVGLKFVWNHNYRYFRYKSCFN